METPLPHPQIETLRVGWEESVRSTISIGEGLTEAEWSKPSPCPGWRLKDLISHLIGLEEFLLDLPPVPAPPVAEKPWIKNDSGH